MRGEDIGGVEQPAADRLAHEGGGVDVEELAGLDHGVEQRGDAGAELGL